jgi:hypothetical protein
MNCSRNDVVLLPIPFTDLTSRKVRPAVVIGRSGADLFLVPIYSVLPNTDVPVQQWRAAAVMQARRTSAEAVGTVSKWRKPPAMKRTGGAAVCRPHTKPAVPN